MPRVRGGRFSATSTGRAFPNVGGVRGGRFSATNRGWRFPPAAAGAAGVFVKGSFAKATGAAPASQVVAHGLGTTPKALLLFATPISTVDSTAAHVTVGFGATDGTTSRCIAIQARDNNDPTGTSNHHSNNIITMLQTTNSGTLAQASFTSWNDTNFTINWTTNDANASIVHFVAIGGENVSAKLVEWFIPNATGNTSITGVGFQPNAVLHFWVRNVNAPPNSSAPATLSFGAMNDSAEQWVSALYSVDGATASDANSSQVTDACIFGLSATTEQERAAYSSMGTDGFTVNVSNAAASANTLRVFSLCLKGVSSKVGSFNKSTGGAPASQSVTGVGFQPKLVLLQTWGKATSASISANALYSLGVSDGTTEGTVATSDKDAVSPSDTGRATKTSKAIAILSATAVTTVVAEADMTSLDSGGFTLSWTTNNATAVEMLYLALA